MAYNTPESVADYLSRFQMQVTERTKGTLSPMLTLAHLPPPIARPTPLWSSTIPRRMPHASRAVSSSLATT